MRKIKKTLVTLLIAIFAVTLGAGLATMQNKQTASATNYVTQDVAMMGRVAGWHGNGNFEVRLILGETDWADETGSKDFPATPEQDLAGLLRSLDFFNKIKLGEKTLAEWGCTACYANSYTLNGGSPSKYSILIPLSMGRENMTAATTAGIRSDLPITILEGALIPSHGYLQGTSSVVYRAGCEYVSSESGVAFGIMAVGKTDVESVKYVQGHDGSAGYFGVSLKGDDYLADGTTAERHPDYYSSVYTTNSFPNMITIDGVGGKTESYGLFNLGSKGKGYFAFVNRVAEEDMQSITIPAGTIFPSRAMRTLFEPNKTQNNDGSWNGGNPVYIFYQTQTDVTFYKTSNGEWVKGLDAYKASEKATLATYKNVEEYRTAEQEEIATILATAGTAIDACADTTAVKAAVEAAKAELDAVKTDAQLTAEEEAAAAAALAKAKEDAKAELAAYTNADDYRTAEQEEIAAILATAETAIDACADTTAVAQAVEAAKAELDAVKTDAELTAAEEAAAALAAAIEAAKAEIAGYTNPEEYREAEQEELAELITLINTLLDSCATEEEVAALLVQAKAALDDVKTDAELTAAEVAAALAKAKKLATDEINVYKSVLDYRPAEREEVVRIIDEAKAAIAEAEDEAAVAKIVADAKAELDLIKTDADYKAEEGGNAAGGCTGTVDGASVGMLALVLAGCVLFLKKRR